jgi:alkaline phosphatase D
MVRKGAFAPSPGSPADFAFAFGSCHQPFKAQDGGDLAKNKNVGIYHYMLQTLAGADIRFLMLLGDQVYSDEVPSISIESIDTDQDVPGEARLADYTNHYRKLYRGYFNESGYRALLEAFPSYMMWDDHDIVNDWGSYQEEDRYDAVIYEAAKTAFAEYQNSHNPGSQVDSSEPFSFHLWHGDVGFFVLDLRSERNFLRGRLITSKQWQHLRQFLDTATATGVPTVFIGSSIPVVHFSPGAVRFFDRWPHQLYGGDVRERWDAEPFHNDRNTLLNMLFDWQAERDYRQVFILSGDVHVGTVFKVERRGGDGTLYQLTSSAFTSEGSPLHRFVNSVGTRISNWGEDLCSSRRLGIVKRNNFGVVRVTHGSPGQGHDVTVQVHAYHRGLKTGIDVRMSPGRRSASRCLSELR